MDRKSFIDALSGGYIESYALDLRKCLFTMQVHVLKHGKLTVFDVAFHHVSHFAFDDERTEDWDQLEVTEMWVDSGPESSGSEEWEVMFSMWDLSHIKLRCTSISIDQDAVR